MNTKSQKIIISDLDDTIKISHTTSHFKTLIRGLFFSHAYTGMPELYQSWHQRGFDIKILSSSPKWIEKKIHKFLDLNKFPTRTLHLRDWIKEHEIKKYKINSLKKIIEQGCTDIILVGDDTEWDPEVFFELKKEYSQKIKKTYIRSVRGRPLPDADAIPFYTAFDIAAYEYSEQRIDISAVNAISNAIINEKDIEFIFPHFVSKPKENKPHKNNEIESIQKKIEERINRNG